MCVFYIIFHIREIYLINKAGIMSESKSARGRGEASGPLRPRVIT